MPWPTSAGGQPMGLVAKRVVLEADVTHLRSTAAHGRTIERGLVCLDGQVLESLGEALLALGGRTLGHRLGHRRMRRRQYLPGLRVTHPRLTGGLPLQRR